MEADVIREITNNNFLLVLLDEVEYTDKMEELVKSVHGKGSRICYVCLSKPYADVVEDLSAKGIDSSNFIFIDVLSSHYGAPKPEKNCIFVSSPRNLEDIKDAIIDAVEDGKCTALVFDTISTLLIYEQTHSIMKFANSIVSEKKQEMTKKLFIILKEDRHQTGEILALTKDLELLADKKIDMTKTVSKKKY